MAEISGKTSYIPLVAFILIASSTLIPLSSQSVEATANTIDIIDQRQERGIGICDAVAYNSGYAQSFTPTHDCLSRVDVHIYTDNRSFQNIQFIIFPDNGRGQPDTSTILATSKLTPCDDIMLLYPYDFLYVIWYGWFYADFPDVQVTIGDRYYIWINYPANTPGGADWTISYGSPDPVNNTDPYPCGEAWAFVNIVASPSMLANSDFVFRTYYPGPAPPENETDDEVPEPLPPEQDGGDQGINNNTSVTCTIDVDPDTLEIGSKGNWITAYIELASGKNPVEINISSIRLNSLLSVEGPTCIGDYDSDNIADLMVKFNRSEIIDIANISLGDRLNFTVTITGELLDGSVFNGTDIILITNMLKIHVEKQTDDLNQPASKDASIPNSPFIFMTSTMIVIIVIPAGMIVRTGIFNKKRI